MIFNAFLADFLVGCQRLENFAKMEAIGGVFPATAPPEKGFQEPGFPDSFLYPDSSSATALSLAAIEVS